MKNVNYNCEIFVSASFDFVQLELFIRSLFSPGTVVYPDMATCTRNLWKGQLFCPNYSPVNANTVANLLAKEATRQLSVLNRVLFFSARTKTASVSY